MRRVVAILAAVLILGFVAATIRLQPAGNSTVVRSGSDLRVLDSRVGFSLPGSDDCAVTGEKNALKFRNNRVLELLEGIGLQGEIAFSYVVPDRMDPSLWNVDGTWCRALEQRAFEFTEKAAKSSSIDEVLRDRRESGRVIAQALAASLAEVGVRATDVRVTLSVPEELQELKSIAEVRSRSTPDTPPLFFVGLDGADWQLLDRYISDGTMPNLQRLVSEGTRGVLETIHPPLSPLIWTTMMTGVGPLEHGVLDFTRFNPFTAAREPITSDERLVPAVWNIATWAGRTSGTFGLWATYVAEPVRGMMVSDRLFSFLNTDASRVEGVVFPGASEARARARVAELQKTIDYEYVKRFLPSLTSAQFAAFATTEDPYGHPISALRRILQETALYDSLARDFWAASQPDLIILYVQGTDSVGHMFAPYAPPRQESIAADEYEIYKEVAQRYFAEIDSLLGEYMKLVSARHGVLMLASDHGFFWGEGRPAALSSFAATSAAKWHRAEGMYLLWGNRIARTTEMHRGGVAQVAPTILSLLGLPVSSNGGELPLDGTPLTGRDSMDYRQFFKKRSAVAAGNAAAASEEVAKLRALGYIGSSEASSAPAAARGSSRTAGSYNNEGLIHRAEKRSNEATAAFEKAIAIDPNLASALWNLSDLLFAQRKIDRADQLLVRALSNQLPEAVKYVIGRAIGYQRSGDLSRSVRLLEAAVDARPNEPELRMFRGRYRIETKDCRGALADFVAVQRLSPGNPNAYTSAGLAALCAGDDAQAQQFFAQSLRLNPNQPQLQRFVR